MLYTAQLISPFSNFIVLVLIISPGPILISGEKCKGCQYCCSAMDSVDPSRITVGVFIAILPYVVTVVERSPWRSVRNPKIENSRNDVDRKIPTLQGLSEILITNIECGPRL